MELAELFELIRKEPVCLFIGSGFSLYAGMPGARRLKELLYSELTPLQQQKIDLSKDLRFFCGDFQALFGRPKLVKLLQQYFDITPEDTHLHDLLGKIAYFKSIITTNYDRLLENGFGDRAAVIIRDQQVFGSRQAKTRILKIHGDIRDGKTLVITDKDYGEQHNRLFKDPFWATVISEIASHHVIFLGYGYEDENVWADFDYIGKKLKSNKKKRILLSPGADFLKQRKLKQLGIDYIRTNGEEFLNGLIAELKANVRDDLRLGFVDSQTALDLATAFDLEVNIKATKNAAELLDIKKATGPTQQALQLTIIDKALQESFHLFNSGYTIKELQIRPEQLASFAYLVEGFKMLDQTELGVLNVAHPAKYNGPVKVRFPEKKFNLPRIPVSLFNNIPGKVLVEANISGFQVTINMSFKDNAIESNFNIVEPEQPTPVNKLYHTFRGLYFLFSGEIMEVCGKDNTVYRQRFMANRHAAEFKKQMEFIYRLKKIEKAFQIKFAPMKIGDITDDDRSKVKKLDALIDHGYYAVREPDGLIIEQMPDSKEVFEAFSHVVPNTYASLVTKNNTDMQLLGHLLHLGNEQISMRQPKAVELSYEQLRAKLVPVDHILVYHYQKFGFMEFNGSQTLWPLDGAETAEPYDSEA